MVEADFSCSDNIHQKIVVLLAGLGRLQHTTSGLAS